MYEIRERDIPEQTVVTEQRHVPVAELTDFIGAAMGRLEAVVARHGDRALGLVGDVRSAADMALAVETATRHFGRLDAVVAAAGVVAAGGPLWQAGNAALEAVWSVNVLGTSQLISAAAPVLIANGPGANARIVAVASSAGSLGLRHLAAYVAAKHAVVGLIRSVALDLAEYAVTANAVSPGSTRTLILEASAAVYGLDSGESFATQQPIGRLIEPSEVAAMVSWLCSPASSAVTGANLAVDGGMSVV